MNNCIINATSRLAFMRSESLRVAGPSPELFRYIRQHRLDLRVVNAHSGYLNVALVKFLSNEDEPECFVIDQDGQPAAVIEALLFDHAREPFAADLVAWPLASPEFFSTAMGMRDGASVLGPQNMVQRQGAPLLVHATPLGWLQAGCEGCVPLKPSARHWLHLAGGPFVVEDIEYGDFLMELLGPYASQHEIWVPRARRSA